MDWKAVMGGKEAGTLREPVNSPEDLDAANVWQVAEAAALTKVRAIDPYVDPQAWADALTEFCILHPSEKRDELADMITRQAVEAHELREELERTRPERARQRAYREVLLKTDIPPADQAI